MTYTIDLEHAICRLWSAVAANDTCESWFHANDSLREWAGLMACTGNSEALETLDAAARLALYRAFAAPSTPKGMAA